VNIETGNVQENQLAKFSYLKPDKIICLRGSMFNFCLIMRVCTQKNKFIAIKISFRGETKPQHSKGNNRDINFVHGINVAAMSTPNDGYYNQHDGRPLSTVSTAMLSKKTHNSTLMQQRLADNEGRVYERCKH
jgi:hypothetical protein